MIYFITMLPKTRLHNDVIMVVVDKLTKATHFILVKTTNKESNITKIYMKQVSRLYGILKAIVSNKDLKFTSIFWKGMFEGFGTSISMSIGYHPQIYGKRQRVNQVIESDGGLNG